MSLDFMKPDIWDGLVLGVILIGLALAILRLIQDRTAYKLRQEFQRRQAEQLAQELTQDHEQHQQEG